MRRSVVVKENAALQLAEAFLWDEEQQRNLGIAFLEEWESTAEYISSHAEGCSKKYKNFRQAVLRRFPYLVIYEIENDKVIVYSVLNAKRHPAKRYKKQ